MTVYTIQNEALEFGCEFTKAIGRQALAMAPAVICTKISEYVGYASPFSSLVKGYYGYTVIGSALRSAANLSGRAKPIDSSSEGKAKDILNVTAGLALLVEKVVPCSLTTGILLGTYALSGLLNIISGTNLIKEGFEPNKKINWSMISEGIVSAGVGIMSVNNAITRIAKLLTPPLYTQEQILQSIERIKGHKNVESAKIIFLSDRHSIKEMNVMRQVYLNGIMKDDDFLLVEGLAFSENNADQNKYDNTHLIEPEINVRGWESHKLHTIATNNMRYAMDLDNRITKEKDPLSRYMLEKEFSKLGSVDDFCLRKERDDYMIKIISALLPQLKKNQKIYVVAGQAHLNERLLGRFKDLYSAIFFADKRDKDTASAENEKWRNKEFGKKST